MRSKKQRLLQLGGGLFGAAVFSACSLIFSALPAQAAPLTFTVNSTGDAVDANTSNNVCETATPGQCTLRAAMQTANAHAGVDTIHFAITGTRSFLNNNQDGYTIAPATSLPTITEAVTIDGASQNFSTAPNSAAAPNPFNGTHLIQVDDTNITTSTTMLNITAPDVVLNGLVLNHSTVNDLTSLVSGTGADGLVIAGSYFGVDPTGMIASFPDYPFNTHDTPALDLTASSDILIGGATAASRNLFGGISNGISVQSTDSTAYDSQNVTIQGNYFGVGSDGVTRLGSRELYNIRLSHVDTSQIGGDSVELGNVIENSDGDGIVIADTSINFAIAANRVVGNVAHGVNLTDSQTGVIGGALAASGNLISGNGTDGIHAEDSSGLDISNNLIGTDSDCNLALPNQGQGVNLNTVSASTIDSNCINSNKLGALLLDNSSSSNTITKNNIGSSRDLSTALPNGTLTTQPAVTIQASSSNNIVGGLDPSDANIIANNSGAGIAVIASGANNSSLVGNAIYDNGGLGIDLNNNGATTNDSNDGDSGPNNLLNFPESLSVIEVGATTKATYLLDVPAGQYRVEFFANTTADPSGFGEGQSFIGSQDVTSPGGGQQTFHTTLSGTGYSNITATTTALQSAQPKSTSEFSAPAGMAPDIALTGEVVGQPPLVVGQTIPYQVTVTNNGPGDVNLNQFSSFNQSLFAVIMPPSLALQSAATDNTNVTCTDLGSATAIGTQYVQNHMDYSITLCTYTGDSQILGAGQSFSVTFNTTAQSTTPASFSNYVFAGPLVADPDYEAFAAAYGSGDDIIDYLIAHPVNNFAAINYPPPPPVVTSSTQSGTHSNASLLSKLAATGMARNIIIGFAILLVCGSLYILRRRKSTKVLKQGALALLIFGIAIGATGGVLLRSVHATAPSVIINELMYNPHSDVDNDEFLELYNTTGSTIDLNGWCFTSGITLCFTSGMNIASHAYAVVSPNNTQTQTTYGVTPLATYTGKLDNGGEKVTLKDASAVTVNSLTYDDVAPWPTSPDGGGSSLELKDPDLDNTLPASWGASVNNPTPGVINSLTTLHPPAVTMGSSPTNVTPNQTVNITATISNATSEQLIYKVDFGSEQTVAMVDDGSHGDGAASDGVYGATIPAQTAGKLVRYRVSATNATTTTTKPGADDTIGNYGFTIVNSSTTSQIPVLQWFIEPADLDDLITNHSVEGDDTQVDCVVAYGNTVIDSAKVRIKGHSTRVAPKKSFDFELPKGHKLYIPGSTERAVDEFDINSDYYEFSSTVVPIAWRVAKDMGMDTPSVFKTRVQANGVFYGLYTFAEEYDKQWREEKGYENYSFYKDGVKRTRLNESTTEVADLDTDTAGPRTPASRNYVLDNEDVPSMINYLVLQTILHQWDWDTFKNAILYKDIDGGGKWRALPWDIDGSMSTNKYFEEWLSPYDRVSTGSPSVYRQPWTDIYDEPDLREMYFRRLRTVADKWYGNNQLFLQQYRAEVEKIDPERQLDYAKWPDNRPDPDSAKEAVDKKIQELAATFLVRYRLPWAVPTKQSSDPRVEIQTVSNSSVDSDKYIELTNTTSESVDISGWQLEGLNYTFTSGSVVLPSQHVYLVNKGPAYRQAHPGTVTLGEFTTDLNSVADHHLKLKRPDQVVTSEKSY